MKSVRKGPSPAMIVAVAAIAFALVGTAVAANDGSIYPKLSKSKVKKIAKKQANKQLKANVNNSHVNLADKATDADSLGGIPAADYRMAYAEISNTGAIKPDPPNANIDAVTNPQTGLYCIDVAFTPAFGSGNGTGASVNGTVAMVDIPATNCNASLPGADASVYVSNAAGTSTNDDFTVLFGAGS
jgi:hypothetical protein